LGKTAAAKAGASSSIPSFLPNPHFAHPFYRGLSFPVVAAFRLLAPRAAG
jgi:hypothetical protein